MAVIHFRANVPENRQLTLPADVPVGEVDVTVRTSPPAPDVILDVVLPADDRPRAFPPRPTNPTLAPEHDAFEAMLPDLMARHLGRYVALLGGTVVAVGDSEVDALTTANAARPGAFVLVRRVTDRPEPTQRLPSIRHAGRG